MGGARRIERGERKIERSAEARLAVVGRAAAQKIGAAVVPVGRQAFEVSFALRIGGKEFDRQRMAVESFEEAGQGGVGGELIAGVAQEQSARVGVFEPFDVLAACARRMPGGSPRTVMTSRRPSIAASRPRSASVAAMSLRQGVSRLSRIASVGSAAQAAAIFASSS